MENKRKKGFTVIHQSNTRYYECLLTFWNMIMALKESISSYIIHNSNLEHRKSIQDFVYIEYQFKDKNDNHGVIKCISFRVSTLVL